jgi:hypothetical protein
VLSLAFAYSPQGSISESSHTPFFWWNFQKKKCGACWGSAEQQVPTSLLWLLPYIEACHLTVTTWRISLWICPPILSQRSSWEHWY